jgi:hypothetical protein
VYDPKQTEPYYLRMCAEQIRIGDDEVTASTQLPLALDALENAGVVAVLGFSFHPMNMSKLRIEKLKGSVFWARPTHSAWPTDFRALHVRKLVGSNCAASTITCSRSWRTRI